MAEQERQIGWLIEGAGTYWCGRNLHDFRPTHVDAVWFATKDSADRVLHWTLPEEYRRTCRTAQHIILGVDGMPVEKSNG